MSLLGRPESRLPSAQRGGFRVAGVQRRGVLVLGAAATLGLPLAARAQSSAVASVALTAEAAAQDVRVLRRALTALHPALTKYRTQAEIETALARFDARGQAARSPGDMLLAAAEMAASVRCGHTWANVLNQQRGARGALLDGGDKLPLKMTLVQGRWLVLASAAPAVRAGDEVVSVDSVPAAVMVERLLPYLRADGSSDGKRLRQLGHDRFDYSQLDMLWPLLSPPTAGVNLLGVRRGGVGATQEIRVETTTLAARDAALAALAVQGIAAKSDAWSLRIEGDIARLVLPTFSLWRSKFDWKRFIADSFAELNARRVPALVIDIRDNEGGDGAIGGELLSYLVREPLRFSSDQSISAYERAPYALARYLDTWDYGFFDRTGLVDRVTEGTAAGLWRVRSRVAREQTIEPVAGRYNGRVFLLVGPENSSATYQFANLTQQARAATLVGQRTGGNRRGLNGGELCWVVLPNSGAAVDIPLLAAGYSADTPDASVLPDIAVARSFEQMASGRDAEFEAVLKALGRA